MLLELSNAFGFPAFQFICSENLSTKQIAEIFKGIAATGEYHLGSINFRTRVDKINCSIVRPSVETHRNF